MSEKKEEVRYIGGIYVTKKELEDMNEDSEAVLRKELPDLLKACSTIASAIDNSRDGIDMEFVKSCDFGEAIHNAHCLARVIMPDMHVYQKGMSDWDKDKDE